MSESSPNQCKEIPGDIARLIEEELSAVERHPTQIRARLAPLMATLYLEGAFRGLSDVRTTAETEVGASGTNSMADRGSAESAALRTREAKSPESFTSSASGEVRVTPDEAIDQELFALVGTYRHEESAQSLYDIAAGAWRIGMRRNDAHPVWCTLPVGHEGECWPLPKRVAALCEAATRYVKAPPGSGARKQTALIRAAEDYVEGLATAPERDRSDAPVTQQEEP